MHWLVLASIVAVPAAPPEPGGAEAVEQTLAAHHERSGANGDAKSSGAPPPSNPPPRTPEERKKLEEDIAKELGAPAPSTPAPATLAPATPAPTPEAGTSTQGQTGGNPFARLLLLPDISAIGSGALAWNHLDVATVSPRGDPFAPAHTVKPIFQELELGVQAVVDPYARADAFLSFTPDGASIEEAFLTTLSLPASLQARAGTFFAPFGRINQQHAHVWDFIDRPLALSRLLAVDALKGAGVDVGWLAPTPWFAELHVGYQALTPNFDVQTRNSGVARLVQFFDVGAASTLGVGVSGVLMQEPHAAWREIYGLDAYLRIRPPATRSYLALQGEVVAQHLSANVGGLDEPLEAAGTLWGGYVQAVWRDGPYFAYGARYERAPAVGGGPEHRVTALATWLPSEFQRYRLQVAYDRLPGGLDGFEALLQAEFAIGAHGAHPF
jgi:hypothetical protein